MVAGNFIGTNPTGTAAVANGGNGINIGSGASDNTIGGSTPAVGNVISGNTGFGIQVDGAATLGNILGNNWVGTGAAGIGALPNAGGDSRLPTAPLSWSRARSWAMSSTRGRSASGIRSVPSRSPGTMRRVAAATLAVGLGGTDPSQYDQLAVSGTATLAGTLQVTLVNGLLIAPFEDYQVLTYGTLAGSFATIQYPSGAALYASYGPSSLDLLSTPSFELVITTADTGAGSLRAAILTADAAGNPNRIWIAFDIPASDPGYSGGAWTIAPASALPAITVPVILDGNTQPGFAGTPIVVLARHERGGVRIGPDPGRGRGWQHHPRPDHRRFRAGWHRGAGERRHGRRQLYRRRCDRDDGEGQCGGHRRLGRNNTIGGTVAGAGNVISGNTGDGVDIDGSDTGTWSPATGSAPTPPAPPRWPTRRRRVRSSRWHGQHHRRDVPGASNLISGNLGDGVEFDRRGHE